MKKRILSLALVLCLLTSFVPAATAFVSAPQYGSNGKFLAPISAPEAGSTPISTRAQLEAMKNNLNGKYHLTASIDLSGGEWEPINNFQGTFDGQGYVIRNLNTTGTGVIGGRIYGGLFGNATGAVIKNVGVEGTNINSAVGSASLGRYIGSISGYGGVISNCYNTGSIAASGSNAHVGGICGAEGSITDSYNTGSVSASPSSSSSDATSYAGGICGYNGLINNCYNTGTVSASATSGDYGRALAHAGGICGFLKSGGTLNDCYSTGTVAATASNNARLNNKNYYSHAVAGGVVGHVDSGSTVSFCYNTGTISGTSSTSRKENTSNCDVGGIFGDSGDNISINDCYNRGDLSSYAASNSCAGGVVGHSGINVKISNCYNTGAATASGSADSLVGGIHGHSGANGTMSNTYWNSDSYQVQNNADVSTKKGVGDGLDRSTGLTTAQMKQQSSYAGFDFSKVWEIKSGENDGYPIFRVTPATVNLDSADSWARDHITSAIDKGFLPTTLQDNYKANITRGEFVTLAMSWLRYQTGMTNAELLSKHAKPEHMDRHFSDTTNADILAAAKLDITAGTTASVDGKAGVFGVDMQFDREQAAIMLMKICRVVSVHIGRYQENISDFGFTDLKDAQWLPDAINYVGNNEVMSGKGENRFAPKDTFQRQESITVFNKMGYRMG